MKIAITTDSNSGITAREAEQLGVFLLPMPVIIDTETHLEGVDIHTEQLFEAMEADRSVSSSQPAPGNLLELWHSVFRQGYDAIVHIPMTSGLSGSCQNAAMLAEDFGGRVYVVDNHRISVTQRASVLEAKHMAQAGHTPEEIKAYLEESAFRASIYLTVADLKYLQRGGRLSSSEALLGTLLNIKPILSIQGYQVEAFAKVRGLKASEKKMIEAVQNDIATRFADVPADKLRIEVGGTQRRQEDREHWNAVVRETFPDVKAGYVTMPCSIATHVGPDCMAMAVYVEEY
ncbi:MAG: DegV family protein [Eubacteriales bacterium]|nr:DegV family protein [Eubacteriales bacterium]